MRRPLVSLVLLLIAAVAALGACAATGVDGLATAPSETTPLQPVGPALASCGTSTRLFTVSPVRFTPRDSGFVNRRLPQVTADGRIYCYEFTASEGMLLARMEDAGTVRVEGRNGNTTCADQQPWTFMASSFVYRR
jgi:hypothetical protein